MLTWDPLKDQGLIHKMTNLISKISTIYLWFVPQMSTLPRHHRFRYIVPFLKRGEVERALTGPIKVKESARFIYKIKGEETRKKKSARVSRA